MNVPDADWEHKPVLLNETIDLLNLKPGHCVVDCTAGLGGHSSEIIKVIGASGRLIAIDQDQEALGIFAKRLQKPEAKIDFVHANFSQVDTVLNQLGLKEVDAMLFDIGISSFQVDHPERGFSFREDAPLDMRMDKDNDMTAFDLINSFSEKELSSLLRDYGQERWHQRIARGIVYSRRNKPLSTTKELSGVILRSVPPWAKRQRIHPATRTFQAIRMAVNRELESLELAMDKCIEYLNIGGHVCVISFHSLEDRIVKNKFRDFAKEGRLKILTKKPLRPSDQEVQINPRSRSARLRAAERIQ